MTKTARILYCLSCLALVAATFVAPQIIWADNPSSTNYVLDNYGFGSGGTDADMNSGSFRLYGIAGEDNLLNASSTNYTFGGGLVYNMQSPIPDVPSLENLANYYDRLKATLNPTSDIDSHTYAMAISKDDFATIHYLTDQGTLKSNLEPTDFHTYDQWGGEDGILVSGLEANQDYKLKVAAIQGTYTQSEFSQEAQAQTDLPTLTFSVDGNANMGVWNEDNNYSSTAVSTLTTSTNAYNGYSVYAFATQPLTRQNGNQTIANYSGSYSSPGSWMSGLGFGYTTSDTSVGGSPKWNSATCPADDGPPLCYAAFNQSAPGDVVVDHLDPLNDGPIEDQEFEVTYKVVTQSSQPAGTYSTSIIYTIVPIY